MKTRLLLFVLLFIVILSGDLFTEEKEELIPTFAGSKPAYDDAMGYNEFYICVGDSADGKPNIKKIEGYVRHRFCYLPKGRSSFEMFKNYEEAILKMDGTVFPISNNKVCIKAFMKKGHPGHGMKNFEYVMLKDRASKYFSGIIPTDTVDDFDANITLSNARANAVVNSLIVDHSINKEQLKSHGVGPAAPVTNNLTDEGKAKNRRVEIVER
ncbi:MAG: OmpA family protein [Candidatus Cloacimonadota bacterium]|nr:OmpA family protein [Candidatus Cloacimonadota bacterium]